MNERTGRTGLLPWALGALSLSVLLLGGCILCAAAMMNRTDARAAPAPTTYVLSPVPIYGQLTPFELTDERGEAFGTPRLRGGLYILQFIAGPADREVDSVLEQLTRARGELVRQKVSARIVAVELGASTPETRTRLHASAAAPGAPWTVLGGNVGPLQRRILTLVSLQEERAWTHLTLLVDQAGGVRGFYDLLNDPRALSALVEDARCVSTCGPVPALAGVAPGTEPEGAACDNRDLASKRAPGSL